MVTSHKKLRSPIRNSTILVASHRKLDLYHSFLKLTWIQFLIGFVAIFLVVNCIFGFLFWLDPESIAGVETKGYVNYFFFSVQTLATIGYGAMYPKDIYGHVLVTLEAMTGLLSIGMFAAIAFARLSLPKSRIVFSSVAVITQHEEIPTLMFRLSNNRNNSVIGAKISLSLFKQEVSKEGLTMRRIYDLNLLRDSTPMLALTWLVMHPIDEKSPLYGLSKVDFDSKEIAIIATVTGLDETLSQTIHAKTTYLNKDILWNNRFTDMFRENEKGEQFIDLRGLNNVVSIDI